MLSGFAFQWCIGSVQGCYRAVKLIGIDAGPQREGGPGGGELTEWAPDASGLTCLFTDDKY